MSISLKDIEKQVLSALNEDIGSGDVTAELIDSLHLGKGGMICREPMVVCGQAWVEACFRRCSPHISINWLVKEGDYIPSAQLLCDVSGPLAPILTAERTALNFLQTLSATATETKRYADKLTSTGCKILDTRKTIPGLRMAQKYAVSIGGGFNHRLGLYDAFLIKENHIVASGSIAAAVMSAREKKPNLFLEVEIENLKQLREALSLPVDRIMLDNFSLQEMAEAVSIRGDKICELEASGNIALDNVKAVAATGVDFISIGSITKSIKAIDLSLRLDE